jgi:enolase
MTVLQDGGLPKILSLTQLEPNPVAEGEEHKENVFDPLSEVNKDKIAPNCVNISRSQFKTVSEMLEFLKAVHSYPEDRHLSFIVNDNKYDTTGAAILDIAMGTGCEYLNMKGFYKAEKIAKVQYYAEMFE